MHHTAQTRSQISDLACCSLLRFFIAAAANGDGSFDYREFLPMMQEKLAELAKRSSADKDFAVPAHSMSTKAILSPPPFCPGLSAARWPPPLHMWLAEQGFPVSAESGFRYKGYNTVDDLLRNKTLDAKELRLCGVPRRAECAHTARPPPTHPPIYQPSTCPSPFLRPTPLV